MILTLNEIALAFQDWAAVAFVLFLRVGAACFMLPAFGEQTLSVRVRLGAAVAFTMALLPILADEMPEATPANWLPEVITGLFLGAFLRLFVMVLQIAGMIAAQATSLSQLMGGAGIEPLPALGHILVVGGLALAAMGELHLRIIEYLILSYTLVPAGTYPNPSMFAEAGVARVAKAFELAFILSSPFLAASLLYNVTLGVINRAMPQLMVAFVGAPAITIGSIVIFFLTASIILSAWADLFFGFLQEPFAD